MLSYSHSELIDELEQNDEPRASIEIVQMPDLPTLEENEEEVVDKTKGENCPETVSSVRSMLPPPPPTQKLKEETLPPTKVSLKKEHKRKVPKKKKNTKCK